MILINCGGTFDLVETLEPSEEKIFFVADSHRPYDVCNIFNDGQVELQLVCIVRYDDFMGFFI